MSKSRRGFDNSQLSILDILRDISSKSSVPTTEGQFRIVDRLRAAMRSAIKGCPLSIYQIAGEMSHLLGATITADQIYSWTRNDEEQSRGDGEAENRRYSRHIPAEYLPAFCTVTGSNEALRILGEQAGMFMLPGPEAMRAELQRLAEQVKGLQAEIQKRRVFLREMERER